MRRLVIVAVLAACSSDGEKEALKFVSDGVTDAIATIEGMIAAKTPQKGYFHCAHAANNDTLRKAGGRYTTLADRIEQLCDHDMPIAMITVSVEKAEAAHAANPNDRMLTACIVNEVSLALKQLKKPDAAKALLARYAIACPDEKP